MDENELKLGRGRLPGAGKIDGDHEDQGVEQG
jgi:hypothetical protein